MGRLLWVLVAVSGLVAMLAVRVARAIWWSPKQIQKRFAEQGIRGPPYRLLYGNVGEILKLHRKAKSEPMELSHEILPRVIPYYNSSVKNYGRIFLHWFGWKPRLNIPEPELIRGILSHKFGYCPKPPPNFVAKQLAGDGLAALEGEVWAKHRRIINPAFHIEQLKRMIPIVAGSTTDMLDEWNQAVSSGFNEIDVSKEFRNLTADVISRTAFGSSYVEGRHIFEMQAEQTSLTVESLRNVYIPGYRFLPTKKNMRGWHLDREVKRSLRALIEGRERGLRTGASDSYGDDLLGLMMTGNNQQQLQRGGRNPARSPGLCMTVEEIIDECKLFFFAGHETTSSLLTWTTLLLGIHQDWQQRARAEVLQVCGRDAPDSESINHLKIVTMILNETLRLYPPIAMLSRYTYKEMALGKLTVPAHTQFMLPIIAVHHDAELWGGEVHEFDPQRFAEGAARAANHPMAFIPFGFGPKVCVGQNFAMVESKMALAMILQRFSVTVSPSYAHAPTDMIALQPQHGAHLLLHPIS